MTSKTVIMKAWAIIAFSLWSLTTAAGPAASDDEHQKLPSFLHVTPWFESELKPLITSRIKPGSGKITSDVPFTRTPVLMAAQDAAAFTSPGLTHTGYLLRGDNRPPADIFKNGFKPLGDNPRLMSHLSFEGNSAFVSTTRSFDAAREYAFGRTGFKTEIGYVYKIDPKLVPHGYCIPIFSKGGPVAFNREFAVLGEIPPDAIVASWKVEKDDPWIRKLRMNPELKDWFTHWAACIRDWRGHYSFVPGTWTAPKTRSLTTARLNALYHTFKQEDFIARLGRTKLKSPLKVPPVDLFKNLKAGLTKSVKLREGKMKLGFKVEGALTILFLGAYIDNIVDVWTTEDSTILEKVASVTSIIPFFGCAVTFAAHASNDLGADEVLEAAACLVIDALSLISFPAALATSVLLYFRDEITDLITLGRERRKFQKLLKIDTFRERYREGWEDIRAQMFEGLQSEEYWREITNKYDDMTMALVFTMSEGAAALRTYTLRIAERDESISDEQYGQLLNGTDYLGSNELELSFRIEKSALKKRFKETLNKQINKQFDDQYRIYTREFFQRFKDLYEKYKSEYYPDDLGLGSHFSFAKRRMPEFHNYTMEIRKAYGFYKDSGNGRTSFVGLKPGPEASDLVSQLVNSKLD